MQFALTEDQTYLSDQIQEFANQKLAKLPDSTAPKEILQRLNLLAEQGMFGLCVPESLDGPGIDPVTLCRCVSVLAEVDASIATAAAMINGFVVPALLCCATLPQQQIWLGEILTGETIVAWCDASSAHHSPIQATAHQEGWFLNGEVTFVPLAAVASKYLVVAKDEQGQTRFFWLDAKTAGLQNSLHTHPLGLRHIASGRVKLEQVFVSADEHLGDTGTWTSQRSHADTQWIQQTGQTSLAAVSIGVARAALVASSEYAKERRQFGKPLAAFQAIQWKIADIAMGLEAASLLVSRAAAAWSETPEQTQQEWSYAARNKATEVAALAGQEAIQIHGGYGFTTEFPVERLYRDAHTLRACWNPSHVAQPQLSASSLHHF